MDDEERPGSSKGAKKDPRIIARSYQMDLCKKATEENVIVYLGTGCGKTHIAVLLMYELGHLIRKPSSNVCVFLAPTVPLVRQQAMVIESSTDFKVQYYVGNRKQLKDHNDWNMEIEQIEVLVMTPQILLHNLRHCFIRMELIALLIFDECHHAQAQTRHPYAQIMKEFYKANTAKCPRIFGMTASPIIGRSNQLNYIKCINSLENLLDAKVYSVDDNPELESVIASPDVKIYFYGPVDHSESTLISSYCKKLDVLKHQSTCLLWENISDSIERRKKIKSIMRMHDNLVFCLKNVGLYGAIQALKILFNFEEFQLPPGKKEESGNHDNPTYQFLEKAASILDFSICDDVSTSDFPFLDVFEEPLFSQKLSLLISILSTYRLKENTKCIVFVKRIIVARALACILKSLKSLKFWKCDFLVGFHSGLRNMSRSKMHAIVEKFSSGEVNLLVATNVAEEGLDIQTCCLVVRFDLPQTVASFIQSRGRARMLKSEFIFLLERENLQDENLLGEFMSGEHAMNKEIVCRSSDAVFDNLDEAIYKVDLTGASISTACSVSLLHHYCAKLPRDKFFTPNLKFYYMDDRDGTICRLILPPNAPLRQADSLPCASKDEAKRAACLNACIELHRRGALSDFLLPGFSNTKGIESPTHSSESVCSEDENLKEELYEMLVPTVLKGPLPDFEEKIKLYFYHIRFIPMPDDRKYRAFGLILKAPLPEEAEAMEVDLHLARGRIVKSGFVNCGMVTFGREEISQAEKFQEMFLKILLDRSEYFNEIVALGKSNAYLSSTFYLLLPVIEQNNGENKAIDWSTVKRCLSSPAFEHVLYEKGLTERNTLELFNGQENVSHILDSLVFVPHNKLFYFVDGLLPEINSNSRMANRDTSYAEHYKFKFGVQLLYPEQPLLKAKPLFYVRNLLHNRIQEITEARELEEYFVELPPELCWLKIVGFSKDIGSSLSLLPSLMHRLENLLVAIELKEVLSASFSEASGIRADIVLEALTTERCMERFSLERFEVLGDAFLKYVVGRHSFLSFDGLDEGQLTKKRSSIVNNSHLCDLAIKSNLQVYIRDELFEPSQYFPIGRSCTNICNLDTQSTVHSCNVEDGTDFVDVKCTKSHHWLHMKTIADAVEALVGAFLVESGFRAAIAFLKLIGIQGDLKASDVYRVLEGSNINLSLVEIVNIRELEESLDYTFKHRGLLLQAFIHPSYGKHSGGCYQKLEFLGDAVLEYLMTSYLYSVYPDMKPGQITDLRSIAVNNNFFAYIAVRWGFQRYLIKDSKSLTDAVNKFEKLVRASNLPMAFLEESNCPKVLSDLVESYIGARILDAGFNLREVWKVMLTLFEPILSFNNLTINPVRELRELCQQKNFCLRLPQPVKEGGCYLVKVEVDIGDEQLTTSTTNHNSKAGRRLAAQKALAKLKDLGYKHKHKSLEEVLRSTRKKDPELIGYNEDPLDTTNLDGYMIPVGKLVIQETNTTSIGLGDQNAEALLPYESVLKVQPSLSDTSPPAKNGETRQHEKDFLQCFDSNKVTESSVQENRDDVDRKKSAKSRLLEICATYYWSPPLFKCCKEEGPCHLKMFTFKVTIQIEGAACTVLECYSESRPRKRAAEEQAAEGALWYLEQLGYIPKT
ncbi:endoribonuclease Dicer homolog 4 isoform X2 [Phalaenopsis equestris]|uniref:endoribonuclease Dicer homolog 4 isoform X2 n=1 Tax=Phalaenopsis equestris TaxID=78828 RepID=UPI0009E28558|nr:endoribonuclease Dicer homolog 4 isoform X2 [Phalaenopsis equestris]